MNISTKIIFFFLKKNFIRFLSLNKNSFKIKKIFFKKLKKFLKIIFSFFLCNTKDILLKHMNENNLESKNYYSPKDFHLNKLGNKVIINELNNVIEQYR